MAAAMTMSAMAVIHPAVSVTRVLLVLVLVADGGGDGVAYVRLVGHGCSNGTADMGQRGRGRSTPRVGTCVLARPFTVYAGRSTLEV
jgi:hypothetical protein